MNEQQATMADPSLVASLPPASPAPICSQAPLGMDCCCCKRCGVGGCDLKVLPCNCCLHTRCCPISEKEPFTVCPVCHQPASGLTLMPMSFVEIDQAQAEAAFTQLSAKRGKKRQNETVKRLQPDKKKTTTTSEENYSADLRTGRWTNEETAYCDKLIEFFEQGKLPIPDGVKLNDFLSGMLKSKQSRLTKKMRNAKLSLRVYKSVDGYIANDAEAREFSQVETDFFASIRCNMERSEIRFHMQKEWRELFSNYCVHIGQKLDAGAWLSSVEEMDRRSAVQKNEARMARRKIMMGYALSQDTMNPQNGVFIDPNVPTQTRTQPSMLPLSSYNLEPNAESESSVLSRSNKRMRTSSTYKPRPLSFYSSPFVGRVIQFIQRYSIPFEHVDAWVPSFVSSDGGSTGEAANAAPSANGGKCRLCFAGCATAEVKIPANGGTAVPLTNEEEFDLMSFGLYSQQFSFDVGCGMPGRIYSNGIASWEQGIHNAPTSFFERCGGAKQWGIQTVLGVPIASPNVGRIVVLFYSCIDRPKDDNIVNLLVRELSEMMPSPQWKLVVELGIAGPKQAESASQDALQTEELVEMIQNHMPEDNRSPLSQYLPGFASIRILLMEQTRTDRENALLQSALDCYRTYKNSGHSDKDAAWMTARDFMILSKNQVPNLKPNAASQDGGAIPTTLPLETNTNECCPRNASCATGGASAADQVADTSTASSDPKLSNGGQNASVALALAAAVPEAMPHPQLSDLGLLIPTPSVQQITSNAQADVFASLAPALGLSASQLAALLQPDTADFEQGT